MYWAVHSPTPGKRAEPRDVRVEVVGGVEESRIRGDGGREATESPGPGRRACRSRSGRRRRAGPASGRARRPRRSAASAARSPHRATIRPAMVRAPATEICWPTIARIASSNGSHAPGTRRPGAPPTSGASSGSRARCRADRGDVGVEVEPAAEPRPRSTAIRAISPSSSDPRRAQRRHRAPPRWSRERRQSTRSTADIGRRRLPRRPGSLGRQERTRQSNGGSRVERSCGRSRLDGARHHRQGSRGSMGSVSPRVTSGPAATAAQRPRIGRSAAALLHAANQTSARLTARRSLVTPRETRTGDGGQDASIGRPTSRRALRTILMKLRRWSSGRMCDGAPA